MLEIVEAPNEPKEKNKIKLFLAGGITNCPNWQKEIIDRLEYTVNVYTKHMLEEVTVFNPRRENFPIENPNASKEQISWEFYKLRESDIIVFWFSRGSLNPIVLLELGLHGISQPREIVIGVDPEYERISDVEIQTKLAKPTQEICYNLDSFYKQITDKIYNVLIAKNNF